MKNNHHNEIHKATEYADTAYKGKADPYYRENIAGPNERKRHLAKGQCKLGLFPREYITGICWDSNQSLPENEEKKGNNFHTFYTQSDELRLPLHSLSNNTKEVLFITWLYLHISVLLVLPVYLFISFIFGGWTTFINDIDVLILGIILLLFSKCLYSLLNKLELTPTGHFVIFNRQTGMIEIANDERIGYHHLPFEEFNAHHRKVHSERGAPSYSFTLLHYQKDLMYQVTPCPRLEDALSHWELIKNFMDTSVPLADIPQFERYRAFDPKTIVYDKKNGRPIDFWYRVDKKFIKKIELIASKTLYNFPSKKSDTLNDAIRHSYKVPEVITYPWRAEENISGHRLEFKTSKFIRYIIAPFFLF